MCDLSPERIEEALALLERYGEGALGAAQAAETVRAALREREAENERLREWLDEIKAENVSLRREVAAHVSASLPVLAPADEAKP